MITKNIPTTRLCTNEDDFIKMLKKETFVKNNKKTEYLNVPISFDIETTSFYMPDGSKAATMYIWSMAIRFTVYRGRTWAEFMHLMDRITTENFLNDDRRIIIYIHNLGFEFQFFRKFFEWKNVFSIRERVPLYALTVNGIEFRCSQQLSNYSLATLARNLTKWDIRKMQGDLDYSLMRHSGTPLSNEEYGYTDNDVLIITAYIDEMIDQCGDISRIPLTSTGFVRNYCRDMCLKNGQYRNLKYFNLIHSLTLTPEEYKMLKECFQGGFTHANPWHVGRVIENVHSDDFTSDYPARMVSEFFPMSRGERIRIGCHNELYYNLTHYCCMFEIEYTGVEARYTFENPISRSKCFDLKNYCENNGRIVSADSFRMIITEQDFFVYRHFYNYKSFRIGKFYRYKRGYLPRELIFAILHLYEMKTRLKGIPEYAVEYTASKNKLNAAYGMTVTDILRELVTYDGDQWGVEEPDIETGIAKYNRSQKRFLFYPWGVWVTAYARNYLFQAIAELKNDYIYSDTDSVKYRNREKHEAYFKEYNRMNSVRMRTMCDFYKIPYKYIEPMNNKGQKQYLGAWDYEGKYDAFKTLGAKRYMIKAKDILIINKGMPDERRFDYSITVSGLNKTSVVPYMIDKYGPDKMFDAFEDYLLIPAEHTGKNTHTYIDDCITGVLTDYMGVRGGFYEESAVHLEAAEYCMTLSRTFLEYLDSLGYDFEIGG